MSEITATRAAKRRDEEVLDAAARVFARRGYADASVQDVADELGILKGSLYHYIRAKEDLLFWLLESVHADVQAILDEVAAEEALAPLDRIALYVRRQVQYNLDNLEYAAIYYRDIELLSQERLAVMTALRRTHERFISGLLKQVQGEGDPRILVQCVLATIAGTTRWYKPGGRISRAAIADQCARYAVSGLGL
jgi:AcrR family transcriptional regulator